MNSFEKDIPYISLFRTVWLYGSSWRIHIVGYCCAYVIAQISLSLSPYALGNAIDILQEFGLLKYKEIILWLLSGLFALIIYWIFHGPARIVERKVALKLKQNFKLSMYDKLTCLELKWHQHHHSGNVISRIQRSSNALYHFAESQHIYIETFVRFIVSILFLLWISIPIGISCLLTSILLLIGIVIFDRKLVKLYDLENDIENETGGILVDYINNMATVLTLRLGQLTKMELSKKMLQVWKFFNKEILLNEGKWFTLMVSLSILQTLILALYIFYCMSSTGTIKIGAVIMTFNYQAQLNTVFHDLSTHISQIIRMNTDVNSIEPILNDIKKIKLPQRENGNVNKWHIIELHRLVYHPTVKIKKTISNIEIENLKIYRGDRVALIGKSGSGKSTFLNVLSGLYKPEVIDLYIDSINFDSIEPLRSITTLIPQGSEIFNSTIEYNITMGLPAKTRELHDAIKLAGFLPVVEMLPNGLNSEITEKGSNLSVGQKQRLALARGLFAARKSSLILIDETTSSLDMQSEQTILINILESFAKSTMLISLHRLHLLPYFDYVIMLNEGRITSYGPIKELLNANGPIKSLWLSYQRLYS